MNDPVSPPIVSVLLVVGVAFVVAVILTPVVARLAVAWGWTDQPDGRRKLHGTPVPAVRATGVRDARMDGASAILELGSGSYHFVSRPRGR